MTTQELRHTAECQARCETYHKEPPTTCDACAAAGESTPAETCREEWDEGNGWQSAHYCLDCWDAIEAARLAGLAEDAELTEEEARLLEDS